MLCFVQIRQLQDFVSFIDDLPEQEVCSLSVAL